MNLHTTELVKHLALFALLVLIVSVVYNGLRRENVRDIVRIGLKKGLVFAFVSLLVFGLGGTLLAAWLS